MGLWTAIFLFLFVVFLVAVALLGIDVAIMVIILAVVMLVCAVLCLSGLGIASAVFEPKHYKKRIKDYHAIEGKVSSNPKPFYKYNADGSKVDFDEEVEKYK